jgi:hypothetical protein
LIRKRTALPILLVGTFAAIATATSVGVGPPVASAAATDGPWASKQSSLGRPQQNDTGEGSHVFGYRFTPTASVTVAALAGRFTGSKSVVLFTPTEVLRSAVVSGNPAGWSSAAINPITLNANQSYMVAVRAEANASTSAVWGVSMPFTVGSIRVDGAVQGWSDNPDPAVWRTTVQAIPDQNMRGLVDVVPQSGPPVTNPDPEPNVNDPFPQTVGVVDSFGQSGPGANLGPGWSAIDDYYATYLEPTRTGNECSKEVHNRYWVKDQDGVAHPTWHPSVDPSGCVFTHEHGDDPRTSDNYAFAQGIPFGMIHGAHEHGNRIEDHVGHKVTVQDNWNLVSGNPQDGTEISRTGNQCDWLSKIHQGTWSDDAFKNNDHEYFLNLRCTDGVDLRLKSVLSFGPKNLVTNVCSGGANNSFATGLSTTGGIPVTAFLDGKREFECIANRLDSTFLTELWKSDGVITFPNGGFINFSPYYVVLNPARYMDNEWVQRGKPNAFMSTVDLCVNDNPSYRGRPAGFCGSVPEAVKNAPAAARIKHPDNPMNGTRRAVHPKEVVVFTTNVSTTPTIRFCTSKTAQNAQVLADGQRCGPGEVEQLVSRADRRQYGWKGSDVGSITVGGQLRGAGFLNEWVRDFSGESSIRYPN